MKSFFRREKRRFSIHPGCLPAFLFAAAVLGGPGILSPSESAAIQLTDMARELSSRDPSSAPIDLVFRGYADLGLRIEAASILERKIRLGRISAEEATPFFETLAVEESRWNHPERLLAICEAAFRTGVRSSAILYSYGTALRMAGRPSDASATFAKIGDRDLLHRYALYAIGQISVEEGRYDIARELFLKVQALGKIPPASPALVTRAMRSQAELLLVMGKKDESALQFQALLPTEEDPLDRLGFQVSGDEPDEEGIEIPAETISSWPARERVLLHLMRGGIARERGQPERAVRFLTRAREELDELLSSPMPDSAERFEMPEELESIIRQLENHRRVRQVLASSLPTDSEDTIRARIVELHVGLLFLDHTVASLQGKQTPAPAEPEILVRSSHRIEDLFRKVEEIILGGMDVDRLVEELGTRMDIFQNLAHPIGRYRLLAKLEKSQEEIRTIKASIQDRRKAVLEGISSPGSPSRFLEEIGRFLEELDRIREATAEQRDFTRRYFDILRKKEIEGESGGSLVESIPDVLATDAGWFTALFPAIGELEERSRIADGEKERRKLALLRPVVARQLADAYVAHAESVFVHRPVQDHGAGRESLRRAASLLTGPDLESGDRVECAINIGSVLAGGSGRWEPYPGKLLGEKEKDLLEAVLPVLKEGVRSTERREEALYLLAVLRMMSGHPEGRSAAKEFLGKFPASPHGGILAVRLAHDALRRGAMKEAADWYRMAAQSPDREASDVGHFMIGWVRFQNGDSGGAIRELSVPLSNPSFSCESPSPFEQSVLSLAVRSWQEVSWGTLDTYPPVMGGGCGGKSMLVLLGTSEESRGKSDRASDAYHLLSRRFPDDGKALEFGKRSVEELLREKEGSRAYARALSLEETFGPESEWAKSQSPVMQEKARMELAGIFATVSERKFEEGIRSGNVTAMREARIGMERFFALKRAEHSDEDPELHLKWGVASLRSGDREGGLSILQALAEQRADSVGERAAILSAETRIAGYERGEDSVGIADNAVRLLLNRFPSEKSSHLAYRSAAAFLKKGEYRHAKALSEEIERREIAPGEMLAEVGLIHAKSLLFLNDLHSARAKADSVLSMLSAGGNERLRDGAVDLVMLASLKEVEAESASEDWNGAANILENLGMRFPEDRQTGSFLLRAIRLYRLGGDSEGALRVGLRYLGTFPRNEECVEIARTVGSYLLERKEFSRAAELFATTAVRFPENRHSPLLLFDAGRVSSGNGDRKRGAKYFSAYRDTYPDPRWRKVFATLSIGMLDWEANHTNPALRELEAGIRLMEKGVEQDAPGELYALAGKSRIVLGTHWAEQFRKIGLVIPLEKSLAIKDRFFRRALGSFEKARSESPVEESLRAAQLSGDLFLDFGKAILESQRPRGLEGEERERYEIELRKRAQALFEKGRDRYTEVLDRLETEEGPAALAVLIRQSLQDAQRMLSSLPPGEETR